MPDPLAKVKAGLQGSKPNEYIPLKSVHVRAKMIDMVAKVNIPFFLSRLF